MHDLDYLRGDLLNKEHALASALNGVVSTNGVQYNLHDYVREYVAAAVKYEIAEMISDGRWFETFMRAAGNVKQEGE